jgi:hypothetical protein
MPELRSQISALKRTIPVPPARYNKADAWVSLATLQEIARSIWPRKKATEVPVKYWRYAGVGFAFYASLSLMFHLWTYIPYRQRNMREMKLGENLCKDPNGNWRITFHGEQLKIAVKRGRINLFDVPFPEKLVPLLENYLENWRPILLDRASQPDNHVFLNRKGRPYKTSRLTSVTRNIVYRYTGKHWHPHIIRTVWATEWIRNTHGDFYTAAIMLNDRLETVIANYAHLLEEDVAEKAYQLIYERNGQGK